MPEEELTREQKLWRALWRNAYRLFVVVGVLAVVGAFVFLFMEDTRNRLLRIAYTGLDRPEGWIFVDSPEVYTRERLINERLAEANWLEKQIEGIDTAQNLVSLWQNATYGSQLRMPGAAAEQGRGGAGGDGESEEEGGASAQPGSPEEPRADPALAIAPSVEHEFRIKSALRDLIRQRMIENKLDDRHDLLSQSLYILKFDTTVFSPAGNRAKAIVRITVKPPQHIAAEASNRASSGSNAFGASEKTLQAWRKHYETWLSDLENRVNRQTAELFAQFRSRGFTPRQYETFHDSLVRSIRIANESVLPPGSRLDYDFLLGMFDVESPTEAGNADRGVLEQALGAVVRGATAPIRSMTRREFVRMAVNAVLDPQNELKIGRIVTAGELVDPQDGQVTFRRRSVSIPELDRYFTILISPDTDELRAPRVEIGMTYDQFYIVPGDCPLDDGWVTLTSTGRKIVTRADRSYYFDLSARDAQAIILSLENGARSGAVWTTSDATAEIRERRDSRPDDELSALADCTPVHVLNVDSGLLSFRSVVDVFDSYSYTVLPRQNASLALVDVTRQARLFATLGQGNFDLAEAARNQGVDIRAAVTTFGSVEGAEIDGRTLPVIGWIVDPMAVGFRGTSMSDSVALNESVMAIVSVPAWWPELNLTVERGWIDEFGTWRMASSRGETSESNENSNRGVNPHTFSVTLPNIGEAIDSIVLGGVSRAPVVTEVDPGSGPLVEGEAARIVIRGLRLWRNTFVTLAGQKADRIEVTPDMRGIIAEFTELDALRGDQCRGSATLRLWTSEGVADVGSLDVRVKGKCATVEEPPPDNAEAHITRAD